MPAANIRLLLEINKTIKDANRSIINSMIKELQLAELIPVIEMVATVRTNYLEEMFNLASTLNGTPPSTDQVKHLRLSRLTLDELAEGSKAREAAIEHAYLDVEGHN